MSEADRVIQQINAVSGHLADNNRQWANTIMAANAKEIADLRVELNGKVEFLRGQVQAYAAFGAKHTDQVEATTAGDVEAKLADEFGALAQGIQQTNALLAELVAKLTPTEPQEPEAPKA